jgi:hypothetical protein
MKFNPCIEECTYDASNCKGCGRTRQEIAETKKLVLSVASFLYQQEYENHEEFLDTFKKSVIKKLKAMA